MKLLLLFVFAEVSRCDVELGAGNGGTFFMEELRSSSKPKMVSANANERLLLANASSGGLTTGLLMMATYPAFYYLSIEKLCDLGMKKPVLLLGNSIGEFLFGLITWEASGPKGNFVPSYLNTGTVIFGLALTGCLTIVRGLSRVALTAAWGKAKASVVSALTIPTSACANLYFQYFQTTFYNYVGMAIVVGGQSALFLPDLMGGGGSDGEGGLGAFLYAAALLFGSVANPYVRYMFAGKHCPPNMEGPNCMDKYAWSAGAGVFFLIVNVFLIFCDFMGAGIFTDPNGLKHSFGLLLDWMNAVVWIASSAINFAQKTGATAVADSVGASFTFVAETGLGLITVAEDAYKDFNNPKKNFGLFLNEWIGHALVVVGMVVHEKDNLF